MLRGQLARKFTRFGLHERYGARATESVITRNLQRPIYPEGMQVIRWLIGTSTDGMFVFGYLTRWTYTPFAMVNLLTALATLCAIETFAFNDPDPLRNLRCVVGLLHRN